MATNKHAQSEMYPTAVTQDGGAKRGDPLRYALIVASQRKERIGRRLADWVADVAEPAVGNLDMIDLAACDVPDDELLQPGGSSRSSIAHRIETADGFVIVTPEYNHSYPASLKRVVDWHYTEWKFKAATIVSYGVQGGLLAAEHLRSVLAELSVVTTRRVVGLQAPWNDLTETGFAPDAGAGEAVSAAVAELGWWSQTLRDARRNRPFTG